MVVRINATPKLLRGDFDAVAILVHWRIWKERNARIFEGLTMDPAGVVSMVIEDLRAWRAAGCFATTVAF